ncbi:adenosylmethionine--8-amino-7-oxononanoate transaminase [Parvicella tangerina]|uniref:Adenosylmethionine-8-amino-7-oxononanoate aminotransferase n=1 Tax=Parvicella tangerina TaxID=2829795 RepID=A0A916NC69_9FLAO|nr:adenosylmethionine--8-amino-7-oxononanoate transaminase [Parvicella tangerina]CAG5082493.1 Adenosylmethionine-8-amino-7-oxononanoate aminotransferase [Parvicella tangerina]
MSRLKEKDKALIWHPFNQMKGADIMPITRAEGVYLYDESGKAYIDAFSSWWVNIHGHSHPYIAEAIARQAKKMEHVAFGGFTHEPAIDFSERLLNLLPNKFSKVFFSDNGSTSTEVALKMTMQYHYNKNQEKPVFVALENGYHGDTFGSMCVTARGGFNEPFEQYMFDVSYIPAPTLNNEEEVLSKVKELCKSGRVAGFIFEPLVQGAGGMLMHDASALSKVIQLFQNHGALCIADEVMTGMGRTGKMFAIEHLDIAPDIICISKGITGGFLPLGLTVVSSEVYDAFYSDEARHTFLHGHSYTGNTIVCASAVANLQLFEQENTLQKIKDLEQRLIEFKQPFMDHPKVRDARQLGCIVAIELEAEGETSYFNTKGKDAYAFLLERGVVMRPLGNVMVLIPPYCISQKDLDKIQNELLNYLSEY